MIFDLDGTLWNTNKATAKAMTRACEKLGVEAKDYTEDDVRKSMGLTKSEVCQFHFPELPEEKSFKVFDLSEQYLVDFICEGEYELYPDLETTLEELSKHRPLYLVSNCMESYLEAFFKATGLGRLFKDSDCYGRALVSKGENLQGLMTRNQISQNFYVGDTEGDLEAARFAATDFVYASYGHGQVSSWDYRVDSVKELISILH